MTKKEKINKIPLLSKLADERYESAELLDFLLWVPHPFPKMLEIILHLPCLGETMICPLDLGEARVSRGA